VAGVVFGGGAQPLRRRRSLELCCGAAALPASATPGSCRARSPLAGFRATESMFEDEEEGDVAWLVDDDDFRGRSSGTGAR
jgi:hypothetical protein